MERLTLEDMIKALKCVASQDAAGDCYADYENFRHMDDNNYKRLVCRDGEDLRDYIGGKEAIGCPYYQEKYGCCFEDGELYWLKDVAELLEELKSYKDAEEQGLLVRLLCKAGTEVFAVSSGSSHHVVKCRIKKIETSLTAPEKISYFLEPIEYRRCSFRYISNEFGKTVFLTREEAEKKLEEMKNGKQNCQENGR